jgi:hypothetical protein
MNVFHNCLSTFSRGITYHKFFESLTPYIAHNPSHDYQGRIGPHGFRAFQARKVAWAVEYLDNGLKM